MGRSGSCTCKLRKYEEDLNQHKAAIEITNLMSRLLQSVPKIAAVIEQFSKASAAKL
jgi:hypothetical protein